MARRPTIKEATSRCSRAFNRPIDGDSHLTHERQLRADKAGMSERQRFDRQPLVMQEAREAFDRRFKIVPVPSQRRLATTALGDEGRDEIPDRVLLMTMCVGQHGSDILCEASGSRVLNHGRNNALTSA